MSSLRAGWSVVLVGAAVGCARPADKAQQEAPPAPASPALSAPLAAADASGLGAIKVRPLGGGAEVGLDSYRGKVLLIVNVASECGYTPQYKPLQRAFATYGARGFTVLGFPCNQFGGQEPGGSAQIRQTCDGFGVSFPVFEKIEVNGPATHPLYRWLKAQPGGAGEIEWNFTKFLVGKDGHLIERFPSSVEPDAPAVTAAIDRALAAPAP